MRATSWLPLALALLGLLLVAPRVDGAVRPAHDPINAVTGDRSWVEAHGATPTGWASELQRIQTHLAWITRRLRARD